MAIASLAAALESVPIARAPKEEALELDPIAVEL